MADRAAEFRPVHRRPSEALASAARAPRGATVATYGKPVNWTTRQYICSEKSYILALPQATPPPTAIVSPVTHDPARLAR